MEVQRINGSQDLSRIAPWKPGVYPIRYPSRLFETTYGNEEHNIDQIQEIKGTPELKHNLVAQYIRKQWLMWFGGVSM